MEQGCPMQGCDGSGHISGLFSSHRSLSGCPLSLRFSEIQQQNETKCCPTPGCDGSGNTKSMYTFHRSIQRCPLIRKQLEKSNLSIEQMEAMLSGNNKKMTNDLKSYNPESSPSNNGSPTNSTTTKKGALKDSLISNTNKQSMIKNKPIKKGISKNKNKLKKKIKKKKDTNKPNIKPGDSLIATSNKNFNNIITNNGNDKKKDITQDKVKNGMKSKVVNLDIQLDLTDEYKQNQHSIYKQLEQTITKLHEQEILLYQKISKSQKEIKDIKNQMAPLESSYCRAKEMIVNFCKEIQSNKTLSVIKKDCNELESCLCFIEDIIENRHKEEYFSLFSLVKNNLKLTNI